MPSVIRSRWRSTNLKPQDEKTRKQNIMRNVKVQQMATGVKSAKFKRSITLPTINLPPIGDDK